MITITRTIYTDDTVYGIRGFGEDYDKFYKEILPTFKYKQLYDDFPWDYIKFNNLEQKELFENHEFIKPLIIKSFDEKRETIFDETAWKLN